MLIIGSGHWHFKSVSQMIFRQFSNDHTTMMHREVFYIITVPTVMIIWHKQWIK